MVDLILERFEPSVFWPSFEFVEEARVEETILLELVLEDTINVTVDAFCTKHEERKGKFV